MKDDKETVKSILTSCKCINNDISTCTDFKEFLMFGTIQRSCAYSLMQISVSIQQLSDDFKTEYKGIKWSSYEMMEDLITNRYDSIGKDNLWNTFVEEIPVLENYLKGIGMD